MIQIQTKCILSNFRLRPKDKELTLLWQYTRKPRPLCKKPPSTLQESPIHISKKPRPLCKKTPSTFPYLILVKLQTQAKGGQLDNTWAMYATTTTTNKNPHLTFHRWKGTRGLKFSTQTKLTIISSQSLGQKYFNSNFFCEPIFFWEKFFFQNQHL